MTIPNGGAHTCHSASSRYRNWGAGEPANQDGADDYVHMFWSGDSRAPAWNDLQNVSSFAGIPINGVVEAVCSGPVSRYPFDGNANDIGTNGNNGTPAGSVSFASGTYATFNPVVTDGSGWITASPPINRDTSMSFAVWIRPSQTNDGGIVYERALGGGDSCGINSAGNFALEISTGKFAFATSTLSGATCTWSRTFSTTVPQIGQWTHVAGVYDKAGTRKIYINGVLESTTAVGTSLRTVSGATLRIGRNEVSVASQLYHGDMDDLRFYDRPVTAAEVAVLAAALPASDTTPPTLSNVSATTTTLTATSNETATGYWIVVARNATAPTAAQVKARVTYAGVTIVASGSGATGAMGAGVVSSFPIAGLSASTLYDFYLVAEDAAGNVSLVAKAQNATALLLNPLAFILPSSVTTERPIMRGGRGYRWFQVLDVAGVPLSGAEVRYRYVRDAAIASAATQVAITDADGLFVVSTPALTTGALASRINFSLQVDQVTHGGRVAAAPWAALPMDYVLGARSLEQSWNVEVKADLTGSLGPQVGGAAKIGGWGATARVGAKVSAGVGVGESVTWTHTVSDYGDFATQQNTYGSYNNTAPLVVAIDAEVGVKVGASADARLGAGAINRGMYVGVGIGGEIAGAFGAGFEYKFPTFFAPGSNDEACPMSALTLSAIKPSAGSALGQFVCASPLSGFFDASATLWKGSATINASAYLSTKQLNKQRSDGNYDSHIAFLGVTGEAGGIYENKANKDGTRTIKKQLFTKTQAGASITPLPFIRTRASARGGENLLSELTYDRTVADSFEHTKLTKYDTLGKPSAVTLTLSSGRADAAKAGFGDLSMSAEVEVSEKISIHTRSPADAQALEDSRATGEIQFDRLPLVQKFQQILATSASPPPGYNVPPGYFIERESVTSPIELSFEVAGAFGVGLDLSVSAKAEGVTAALTERGTVTAYSVAGGGAMWKPLLIESYPIADAEIEGLRISPVTIAGKVGTALTNATRNAVLSVGGNVESAGNQIVNGTSAVISTAGSYANTGWRFVLSKASALVQSQLIASTQLKAASAASKVIGAVHFVNLLDPSNVNIEVFPSSFTLQIGDVLSSLAAASVPANQVSRLVLMRFDRVTGQTVLVPGTLAADQNSYSATVQRRGAYFLVYDVEAPTLTQLLAGVAQASPRVVMIAGSFDNRDLTGLDAASFSVKVDGVEMATSVGVGSMINSRTGEFRVPVSTGLLATGSPASVVMKIADGAGNVAQTLRCAYAVASDVLLKPTTSTACPALATGSLNITGNASPDRTIDVILLTRYLLGFRDASLTSGLTITGTRTSAVDIANFIGNALLFDVVARENVGAPHPMIDTLILLRLAQGISDDALLAGIQMPNGAGMTTPSGIRALVNAKFGTAY